MPAICGAQGERTDRKCMVRVLPDHWKVMYGASAAHGTQTMMKGQHAQ